MLMTAESSTLLLKEDPSSKRRGLGEGELKKDKKSFPSKEEGRD